MIPPLPRGAGAGTSTPAGPEALREAARGFEALVLSTLLKGAVGEESGAPLMGTGAGAHVHAGLLETYLAEHLSRAGGLGLQDALVRALGGEA